MLALTHTHTHTHTHTNPPHFVTRCQARTHTHTHTYTHKHAHTHIHTHTNTHTHKHTDAHTYTSFLKGDASLFKHFVSLFRGFKATHQSVAGYSVSRVCNIGFFGEYNVSLCSFGWLPRDQGSSTSKLVLLPFCDHSWVQNPKTFYSKPFSICMRTTLYNKSHTSGRFS